MMLSKVHLELFALYHRALLDNIQRLSWGNAQHIFVDVFVETFRAAAYMLGHMVAIALALWIVRRSYSLTERYGRDGLARTGRLTGSLALTVRGWMTSGRRYAAPAVLRDVRSMVVAWTLPQRLRARSHRRQNR